MTTRIDLAELRSVGGFFALRQGPAPEGAVAFSQVYAPPARACTSPSHRSSGEVARASQRSRAGSR
ncbi:hypothetical protein ABZ383_29440, partial [Streptomyces sp. NPDC005900]